MKKLYLLSVFLLISVFVSAQYEVQWEQTFGGASDDVARSVIETYDNGLVVCGYTKSKGSGSSDMYLVKVDSDGNYLWEKYFGGFDYDFGYSVVETADLGLLAVGSKASYSQGGHDLWVIKLDSKGNMLWEKTFGGEKHDFAKSVVQTSDNGFAIAGYTKSKGNGQSDFWVLKINQQGTLIWEKTFGGDYFDEAYSIIETADEGLVVAGSTGSKDFGHDFWIIKLNSRGEKIWEKVYGGDKHDLAYSVYETKGHALLVAGTTSSRGAGFSDIWLMKLDMNGNKIWGKVLGRKSSDAAHAVIETAYSEICLIGFTMKNTRLGFDMQIVNLDEDGYKLWDNTIGGNRWEEATSLIETKDRNLIVAGYTKSKGNGGSDFWLMKMKPVNKFERFAPRIVLNNVRIVEPSNNNKIDAGEMAYLKFDVTNIGKARANGIYIDIMPMSSIQGLDFTASETIRELNSDASKSISIPIKASDNVISLKREFKIKIQESQGYDSDPTVIAFETKSNIWEEETPKNNDIMLASDVDINIPKTATQNNNTFAIVIGIQNYKYTVNAEYASRDAQYFYEYAKQTFNIPEKNIYYIENENATLAEFEKIFGKNGWLERRVKPINKDAEIIVYYSGHGAPDPTSQQPFLIPYDVDPNYVSTGRFSMEKMIKSVEVLECKNANFFIDACFSGVSSTGDALIASVRPGGYDLQTPEVEQKSNITIFSASEFNQYSNVYHNQKHGLFTYYLLKGMQGAAKGEDNELTIEELYKYINRNVSNKAYELNKEQNPTYIGTKKKKTIIQYWE